MTQRNQVISIFNYNRYFMELKLKIYRSYKCENKYSENFYKHQLVKINFVRMFTFLIKSDSAQMVREINCRIFNFFKKEKNSIFLVVLKQVTLNYKIEDL